MSATYPHQSPATYGAGYLHTQARVTCYGLERWINIAVISSICHDYVVCSNSWQFRPCILSLLSAHSISMRFAQIASRSQLLNNRISHHSQQFNLLRMQLFFAAAVAYKSCVPRSERLQCWQRPAPPPSAPQSLLPPPLPPVLPLRLEVRTWVGRVCSGF